MNQVSVVPRWSMVIVLLTCTLTVRAASVEPPVDPPAVDTIVPASNEHKALGVPNGVLEARPTASQSDSPLGALDPRNNDLIRVVMALGLILVLLLGVRMLMKRAGGLMGTGRRPSGVLQVHARYPISRGQHMVLVQVGSRLLLVHQGGGSMRTLSEFSGTDAVDLRSRLETGQGSSNTNAFEEVLKQEHDSNVDLDDIETVDLTGSRSRSWWRRVFGGSRAA